MRRGDFEVGWRICDRVLETRRGVPCWHLPRHEQYLWDGTPLDGRRVLIRCYHGLGDTIQFIRYVPAVMEIAREVIVWAQPPLIPLLETVEGIDRLLPLHDGVPDVGYDIDVELMELAHVFRTTLSTIPCRVPYLHVSPAHGVRRGDGLHVGIVWRSGGWDDRRSVPTALLEPLAQLPNVQLHPLRQGSAAAEWPEGWGRSFATDDPVELARRMRALDLVVSVDSFPLHLAGALGVPTWALLHADPDWRWMLHREDSPWYPSMRLWRQRGPGDWSDPIKRIAGALRQAASKLGRTSAA
jgi:hypothetical protein